MFGYFISLYYQYISVSTTIFNIEILKFFVGSDRVYTLQQFSLEQY